jgi:hypothetical protein
VLWADVGLCWGDVGMLRGCTMYMLCEFLDCWSMCISILYFNRFKHGVKSIFKKTYFKTKKPSNYFDVSEMSFVHTNLVISIGHMEKMRNKTNKMRS